MHYNYLIIGASAAGIAAASKIRSLDSVGTIGCIDKQSQIPYNTCLLVDVLSQEKNQSDIALKPNDFFVEKKIDLILGTLVQSIYPEEKKVEIAPGDSISYGKLLLATGTTAREFSLIQGKGVFHFHQLPDVGAIQRYCIKHQVKRVLIIGAGLSGVEAADALVKKGYQVSIIERKSRLLPEFLDKEASLFLFQKMSIAGVQVLCDAQVTAFEISMNGTHTVTLDSGKKIECDMTLVTIGSVQNTELAKKSGLTVDDQGIVVNECLRTSDTHIFAAGDVIGLMNPLVGKKMRNGTWPEAVKQGMIAAQNMAQLDQVPHKQGPVLTSSRFFEIAFVSGGRLELQEGDTVLIHQDNKAYYRFIVKNGQLVGVVMIGQLQAIGYIRRALVGLITFDLQAFLQEA